MDVYFYDINMKPSSSYAPVLSNYTSKPIILGKYDLGSVYVINDNILAILGFQDVNYCIELKVKLKEILLVSLELLRVPRDKKIRIHIPTAGSFYLSRGSHDMRLHWIDQFNVELDDRKVELVYSSY